jgi:long-chain-fatty-acid--CoA ligase ACSBG
MLFRVIVIIIALVCIVYWCGDFRMYKNCKGDGVNLIKSDKSNTIIDVLKLASKKYGNKPALKTNREKDIWDTITYKDYYKYVKKFAESLNYFLGNGTNVGIIGCNSPGWFYGHLGTMMNGGSSVGMYTTLSPEMCKHIIENANIEALLVEDTVQLEKLAELDIPNVRLIVYYSPIDEKILKKFTIPVIGISNFMKEHKKIDGKITSKDTATIIYTSGTTGNPKGVVITHKNIMSSINNVMKAVSNSDLVNLNIGEDFVSYLPLNHIAAQLMDIYIPIVTLGTVWFADKNALKGSLKNTLKSCRPTIFIGVPRVWEKMQEQIEEKLKTYYASGLIKMFIKGKIVKEIGLDRCKLCITAAAPISTETKNFFSSIGLTLYDVFGMSETTGPISMSLPGKNIKESSGRPVMRVMISKDGEILVKGNNLFEGYYGDKRSKKQYIKNGWFKTGDLGRLDSNGYLYITGRAKELIITAGGENISPAPIESSIHKHLMDLVDYVILIGDKRKFLSVLLVPKIDQHSKKLNVNFRSIDKTIRNADECNYSSKLKETVQKAIDSANNLSHSNACKVQKWLFIENNFTVGNEITPTLKLRRSYINDKYKRQIDKLYSSKE